MNPLQKVAKWQSKRPESMSIPAVSKVPCQPQLLPGKLSSRRLALSRDHPGIFLSRRPKQGLEMELWLRTTSWTSRLDTDTLRALISVNSALRVLVQAAIQHAELKEPEEVADFASRPESYRSLASLCCDFTQSLRQRGVSPDGADIFEGCTACRRDFMCDILEWGFIKTSCLKQLRLVRVCLEAAALETLKEITLTNLEILDVSGNLLEEKAMTSLVGISLKQLRSLDISRNQLGCTAFQQLCDGDWPELTYLGVGQNDLQLEGFKGLVHGDWPQLATINVEASQVPLAAMKDCVERYMPNLQFLVLESLPASGFAFSESAAPSWCFPPMQSARG